MEGLRGRTIPGSEPLLQERYCKTRSPHAAQPRYRRRLLSLAVACSAVLGMTVCYPPSLIQADYSTGKGEQRSVTLADGSRVTLNTDSALAIHFDDSARRVELLQGEAFFEVAKREHQPFVVTAEGRSVRAVGTAFNVQLRPSQTKVELVEGIVEIEDGQHRERLHAGQTALIGADHIAVPSASPSANMALWREGYLQFDGLPLREAVAQINRYRPGRVLLLNDALADKRVSGLFRLDALDQALASLKSAVPALQTVGITPYLVVLH
jgi:transmembrane sensor